MGIENVGVAILVEEVEHRVEPFLQLAVAFGRGERHDPEKVNGIALELQFLGQGLVLADDRRHEHQGVQISAAPERLGRISVRHGMTVAQPGFAVVRKMGDRAQGLNVFLARFVAIENQFDSAWGILGLRGRVMGKSLMPPVTSG